MTFFQTLYLNKMMSCQSGYYLHLLMHFSLQRWLSRGHVWMRHIWRDWVLTQICKAPMAAEDRHRCLSSLLQGVRARLALHRASDASYKLSLVSFLPNCDLVCDCLRLQVQCRYVALKMEMGSRSVPDGLWTFPCGNIYCALSSTWLTPDSWAPMELPGFSEASQSSSESSLSLSQCLLSCSPFFSSLCFHSRWSLQAPQPLCLNCWLQVRMQLGPPQPAMLVFLQHCFESCHFPAQKPAKSPYFSWHDT